MKYLIILAFFVGASFACRTYRQSCSHYPIDNEECCEGWECRVPNDEERREGDGSNTRCMDITSTTTTEATTTQSTTTERACRTLYQSCSNSSEVSEDSCCTQYNCRMPRTGERGDGQGNTRCFVPDNEGGNEDETTTSTTTEEPTTTEAACVERGQLCEDDLDCCFDEEEDNYLTCRMIVNGTGTCEAEATCKVERDTCNLDAEQNECCDDLTCEADILGQGRCTAQTEPTTTTTTTTTTQTPCRRATEECNAITNNECCDGLECRGNATSPVTGTCQAITEATTTTSTTTTQAPAQCRRRDQECSNRRNSERRCCDTQEGANEDLVCKRKEGERRPKCHLRSEPECQTRGQECRSEGDCCQYRDEERKICYKERRGRRGTCDTCRQTEGECRRDSDCCNNVEGEEVTCVRDRRRGEGKCQVRSTTTTTQGTTSERTRRTTERRTRRTTASSTTERRTRSTSTTTAPPAECKREGQQCQNTTECCQERDQEFVCQAGILGPILSQSTCQRQGTTTEGSTTTQRSTSTTEEGSSSTLVPAGGCSQRGGPCPTKKDEECCADLKCVAIDENVWQCGYRGVDGNAIP